MSERSTCRKVVFRELWMVGSQWRTPQGMDSGGRSERQSQVASDGGRTRYQGGTYGLYVEKSGRMCVNLGGTAG